MASNEASATKSRKRPLTIPTQLETIDGVEWLTFVYTAKGVSTNYTIRIDISSVPDEALTSEFKILNSVYPKAFVDRKDYRGNRWEYETTVNEIGWRLTLLNQDLLVGKRGLLQRAVDSKSRRVARVEKNQQDRKREPSVVSKKPKKKPPKKPTPQPREPSPPISRPLNLSVSDLLSADEFLPSSSSMELSGLLEPSQVYQEHDLDPDPSAASHQENLSFAEKGRTTMDSISSLIPPNYALPSDSIRSSTRLIVETVRNASPYQIRCRMDMDSVPADVDREFIIAHQPFPKPRTPREFLCNNIAWKLAYLNSDIFDSNMELLQRTVDVYLELYEDEAYAPRPGKRLMESVFGH